MLARKSCRDTEGSVDSGRIKLEKKMEGEMETGDYTTGSKRFRVQGPFLLLCGMSCLIVHTDCIQETLTPEPCFSC